MPAPILLCALCALCTGCGLGLFGDEAGGADNLPVSGAGPYRLEEPDFDTPADEPYVLAQAAVSLLDPSVQELDDGSYEIFYTRVDDLSSEIWSVTLPSIHDLPEEQPRQILSADAPWEAGAIGAAALLLEGEERVLYYRGGGDTPAIGRAVSVGPGAPFIKDANNPIAQGDDPSVVRVGDGYVMVHSDALHHRILWRDSADGRTFGEPREILTRRTGTELAFDRWRVSGPSLIVFPAGDGGWRYGLFYAGATRNIDDELVEAIGYVGSFDGENWQRFLDGEPVFASGANGAGGPAPVIRASSATLFFHQPRQGRGRIGVALSP